jgi:hypothetical protein
MCEFCLALKMMTAAHYRWPMPPERPAIVQTTVQQDRRTPVQKAADDKLLKDYSERLTRCGTGRLVESVKLGLMVPEMQTGCE